MRAVANYGVFDVVSRTLRVGSDVCNDFGGELNGADPSDPTVYVDDYYCFYGGQVDPVKGDCAATTSDSLRRFCPCSQFGKGHDMIEEHSFCYYPNLTYILSFSR